MSRIQKGLFAVLFKIMKIFKQLKCSSVEKWSYISTCIMEYYVIILKYDLDLYSLT